MRRNRLWLGLPALLLGLMLLTAILASREASLRWLLQQAAQRSNGALSFSGVRGALLRPVHIGRLQYKKFSRSGTPEQELTLENLDLIWSPAQLLRGRIGIDKLQAERLTLLTLKKSEEPIQLPASLAVPFEVELKAAQLQQLLIISEAGVRTELRDLHFSLQGGRQQWRLQDARAVTRWGNLDAVLTLGARPPFALAGRIDLQHEAGQAQAALGGDLSALAVKTSFDAQGARGQGDLVIAPFDAFVLRRIALQATGIDPSRFGAGWPQAAIALELSGQVQADQRVSGALNIVNALPAGPIDQQRLPLHGISAQLDGTLQAANIQDIVFDFAAAGRTSGSGSIKDGLAAFALHADKIDLKAIDSKLNRTAIAGDVTLSAPGGRQVLTARLGQERYQLAVDATLADGLLQLQQARLSAGNSALRLQGQARLDAAQAFAFSGSIEHFDPSDFGAYPAADVNAALRLDGHLAPGWQVAADLKLQPSRLLQQPLSGQIKLSANPQRLQDVDLELRLGGNALTARGNFGAPQDRLALRLDAQNLALLQAGLAGALRASGTLGGSMAAPQLAFEASAQGLALHGKLQPKNLARSMFQARGNLALRGAGPFRLQGRLAHIDPAAFGAYPGGDISGDFDASGKLARDWLVALDFALQPGTLLGAPLSGHGKLQADAARIANADIALQLANNSVMLKGNFGAPQDRLDWRLDARQLGALGPEFGGALKGEGSLGGSKDALQFGFALDGSAIRLPGDNSIKTLRASGRLQQGADGPLQADIALGEARSGALALQSLRLQASGSRRAHTIELAASHQGENVTAVLAGGWQQTGGWQGVVRSLQNRGAHAFALRSPAPLQIAPGQFALTDFALALPSGSLNLQSLQRNGTRWQSRGRASGIALATLAQWPESLQQDLAGALTGSLTFGADWALDADRFIDGSMRVFREGGDVTLRSTNNAVPLALGLSKLALRADIVKNALRLEFELEGSHAGSSRLIAGTKIAGTPGHWSLPATSPLNLSGTASLPALDWIGPVIGRPGLDLQGRLALAVSGSGTLGAPRLAGEISGDQLGVRWLEQGVKLRNGVLRAQLQDDRLLLKKLAFEGEQGSLNVQGEARFANARPSVQMTLTADQLLALSSPDRLLVLSGESRITLDQQRLQLGGKFRAERALIELPGDSGPTISDDVVVLGREPNGGKSGKSLPLRADVTLELGQRFFVKGRGLDAQVGGSLRLRVGDGQLPRANGSIEVLKGTYAAYGQKLEIRRGVLAFSGPLDNPGLNILAVRPVPEREGNVEAGVEVRGNALAPRARLVSTPAVPDTEKLSWLVLGHGTDSASGSQFDALSAAANALFGASQGASLQARLAQSVGLDEVGIGRAQGLESTVLTLGKRLSSRAFLSYEQGVSGAAALVKLRYQLSRRLSLQAETGTSSALDLLYTWSFD
ncbi:translocation/assembly module TamB domain-containing protein [Herminiimonas sp. CN]|uniref:translocation/assembly module TamB domain-containing protein n=1 Tax=Herminiimonas sp. CN TaxID=1349818 RepID=UPI0004744252|nr:translocation/assembly module TamB domain-containing protein [Herminiimonas sp. CN]